MKKCGRCKSLHGAPTRSCPACLEYYRATNRRKYERDKSQEVCVNCSVESVAGTGYVSCEACMEEKRERYFRDYAPDPHYRSRRNDYDRDRYRTDTEYRERRKASARERHRRARATGGGLRTYTSASYAMGAALIERVKAEAEKRYMSASAMVRMVLESWLEQNERREEK